MSMETAATAPVSLPVAPSRITRRFNWSDAANAADAYAAYADARKNILKKCAIIVRKHYPKPPRG